MVADHRQLPASSGTVFPLPPDARKVLMRLRESSLGAGGDSARNTGGVDSSPGPSGEGAVLVVQEREYSAAERREMARDGRAMPDGSFPIPDVDALEDAIRLAGHADDPSAARKHIITRARALGALDKIPAEWGLKEATPSNDTPSGPEAELGTGGAGVAVREHVELIEALALVPSGGPDAPFSDRHIVEVTLIRSGDSRNGNHYPADVLARSVPLFEGAIAFADHNRDELRPERSVRDIVGHYRNVRAVREGVGTKVRGDLHLLPGTDWLFHLLRETEHNPAICGLSIDAMARLDEARSSQARRVVEELTKVNSVDVVTRPSAGGGVVRVIQSDGRTQDAPTPMGVGKSAIDDEAHPEGQKGKEGDMEPQNGTVAQEGAQTSPDVSAGAGAATPVKESGSSQPQPAGKGEQPQGADLARLIEQMQQERDAAQRELARVTQLLAPSSTTPTPDPSADVARLVEEIKRERDVTRAGAHLRESLSASGLPEPVQQKLHKKFAGRVFVESELTEAIGEEKDVLAALSTTGEIRGMGYERQVTVGMNEYEQLQAAFDKLFDITESEQAKSVPSFSGIREAFAVATGVDIGTTGGADRPLREAFAAGLRNYVASRRLQESEVLLREADVTTASFSYLLGTSMNKRLLKDYQAWPSEWQKFATITAIKDFKQQDRVRLGAFGSLSTVAEDAAYTTLTVNDTRAIYTPTKRGNLVQVTRETIINDDLYAIKQIPQKLAVAAAFTLAEFVYNLLAPNFGNIYDAHPLFDSVNHANTGVLAANLNTAASGTALSSSALQTAVIKMRKQTNLAGKPIGLKPRYLLVCPDLEFTAMTLLRSAGLPGGNNNDINPMMGYAEPIVSPQLNSLAAGPASTTICIAVADPRVIDTLEVGFVGGQANPVLLIQDMPLYGLNFTQDTISYKVRHEYGGAVVDYRGFYLINN